LLETKKGNKMKLVFTLFLLFTVGITTGSFFVKSRSPTNSTTADSVVVSNNTVSGNITDDLKSNDESSLLSENKTVVRLDSYNKRIVYFNSDFNRSSVQAAVAELKQMEAKSTERILLALNSPGGSVVDGAELISQMQASKAPVDTVCLKLCASMAAITHSYGVKRYALDKAILMFHPASGGAQGQVPNMLSLLKTITRYVDKMNANIINRSNFTKDEFERLVAYELWIDSEDALKRGLIDAIVNLGNIPNVDKSSNSSSVYDNQNENPRVKFELISPYAKELWGN